MIHGPLPFQRFKYIIKIKRDENFGVTKAYHLKQLNIYKLTRTRLNYLKVTLYRL